MSVTPFFLRVSLQPVPDTNLFRAVAYWRCPHCQTKNHPLDMHCGKCGLYLIDYLPKLPAKKEVHNEVKSP